MAHSAARLTSTTSITLLMTLGLLAHPVTAQVEPATESEEEVLLAPIVISAEDQIKQALGVSQITAQDIARQPVVNDISQIIRKQPGVNLTGTTASGAYGNNRQIDIRGMGPENTLILIDGRPVNSRSSAKMGRSGERDSAGDSNWVAAELVDRIEVIRGPAAARYGSGASGGVVNIITKRPTETVGNFNLTFNQPGDSSEGGSKRANFMMATPLSDKLSFRLTGNINKSDGDDPDINIDNLPEDDRASRPAGRAGAVNKDIGALFTFAPVDGHEIEFDATFSRQSTLYTGESENSNAVNSDIPNQLLGEESRVIYRRNLALTHRGEYAFGESFSYLQWENTRNSTVPTGLGGSGTGQPNSLDKYTNVLDNVTAKTEWVLPFAIAGRDQSLTLGAEFRHEKLSDPVNFDRNQIVGAPEAFSLTNQQTYSVYAESNIEWNDRLTLTPALRLDHNSEFGNGISPSLNAEYRFSDEWKMKVGVARAFKAPNLYQLNPTYYWNTMGNGCPIDPSTGDRYDGPCYVQGNPDLIEEHSVNKEIGIAYEGANGVTGNLTYFHNDYKNRITQSRFPTGTLPDGTLFKWENTPEAVVSGLEGSFSTDLGEKFALTANATYMLQSKDKQTDQPLSLVPDYTVNAALSWYATEDVTMTLSATHYGKVKAPTFNPNNGTTYESPRDRQAYTLFGLNSSWTINDKVSLSGGIDNLFNKQLYRSGVNGDANSYNEPGRSFYVSLHTTF